MTQWGKGRADPRAACNLCLILKIVLQNLVVGIRGGGGAKNNRNLNVARELEVVAR